MEAAASLATWQNVEHENFPFAQVHKRALINSTVVTVMGLFAAIAATCFASAGVMMYLRINILMTVPLFGAGGALVSTTFVAAIILIVANKQTSKITYNIVTWNVGADKDYINMRALREEAEEAREKGETVEDVLIEFYTRTTRPVLKKTEEEGRRNQLFRKIFEGCESPDIVCLQESFDLTNEDIHTILPGYASIRFISSWHSTPQHPVVADGLIAWNPRKFTCLSYAYYENPYRSEDTIVLLKDVHGKTLCVHGAHTMGFSLAYEEQIDEVKKADELNRAKVGDSHLETECKIMEEVDADLRITAGDFNVTREHYQDRLTVLENYDYITDASDTTPTIFDANLRNEEGIPLQAKLDHIYAQSRQKISIKKREIKGLPALDNFDRPSDHQPVRAQVTLG